jgi:DMSO/TMAO reductase YedYZ molybdopterin-dependent catalytic subunit
VKGDEGEAMRGIKIGMAVLLLSIGCSVLPASAQKQAATTGPSEVTIGGAVTTPLTISVADLKKMPRTTLHVTDEHSHQAQVYQGVALATLLQKAGVPHGEQIRGPWMAAYVIVEAADGYRVVFSIAELDSAFLDSDVLLADSLDGAPMGVGQGPLKLVAPRDKRPARWVRMVKSITVVRALREGK